MDFDKLTDDRLGEPSSAVRVRVEAARERQRHRLASTGLTCNADLGPGDVRRHCQLDDACRSLIRQAMSQLQMTARAYHRVLKIGRTIADLADDSEITLSHLAEALQYRPRRWG